MDKLGSPTKYKNAPYNETLYLEPARQPPPPLPQNEVVRSPNCFSIFKNSVSQLVIKELKEYYKQKKFVDKEDFKLLSRKLTHKIAEKFQGTAWDAMRQEAAISFVHSVFAAETQRQGGLYSHKASLFSED